MQINYIDYSTNLFQEVIDDTKAKVYIFDNKKNKIEAKKYYKQPLLAKASLFLTLPELKEKLFITDKVLLKEEKLTIIFYELLTKADKESLKVNGYNDIIDLSAEFFNFYEELNEYNIDKIANLKGWQLEKYLFFEDLRKRYIEKMDKLAYTDKTLVYDFANFNPIYLTDYQEIVFMNLLESTPKERKLISKLESEGKRIQVYNQIATGDYDEEQLKITDVTLPKRLEQRINIYQSSEDFLQIINCLTQISEGEDDYIILDGNFTNSNYHNLLSSQRVKIDKVISFTNSNLYRFLSILHNLLKSANMSRGELKLSMEALLSATYVKVFRDYYGLSEVDLKKLLDLAQADYVYFNERLAVKGLEKFKGVIDEVKKISELTTLGEFIGFLESLAKEKLVDYKYNDVNSQYLGALAELDSIEQMNLVSLWDNYFNNTSEGIFKLILNYIRFKEISLRGDKKEDRVEIKNLLMSSFANHQHLIMLNITEGTVPTLKANSFLLTEEQRTSLGLRSSQDIRLKEKYLFFRHILSSKEVTIYTIKNEDENIDSSSFLEELRLKYNLPLQKAKLNEEDLPLIIDNIFANSDNTVGDILDSNHQKQDRLKLELDDFKDQELSMSYYKFATLTQCHYCFYLEHISKLSEEQVEFKKKVSPKMIGIIVHNVFEAIVNNYGEEILINNQNLDQRIIRDVIKLKLRSYELKLPNYYEKYYHDVLFELIETSIRVFFDKLKRKASNIKKIDSEWSINRKKRQSFLDHNKSKVYLKGRLDLVLEGEDNKKYIIDYKTGSGSQEQLDFYSLLYNPNLDSAEIVEKSIYNVMKENFEDGKLNSEEEFAKKLEVILQSFLDSKEYSNEYSYYCNSCNYSEICKVVLK